MVYLGRPSHGCFTCRARRIKCDEGRPTCRRCEKSKRECGGYKPEWDAIVSDNSPGPNGSGSASGSTGTRPKMLISRHGNNPSRFRSSESSSSSSSPRRSFSSSSSSSSPAASEQQEQQQQQQQQESLTKRESPPRSPTIPLTERAACLFAANFILLPHTTSPSQSSTHISRGCQTQSQGFLSYLAPLLSTAAEESPLKYAFHACALALLSNLEKSCNTNLKTLTLKTHTLALGRTHSALKDPATAEQDSTLATVLLLSLFESITAVKETEMLLWKTHLMGAIQLVKARGRENLRESNTGRVLFSAVRQHIISLSLSHGQGPPLGVDFWMDGVEEEVGVVMVKSQRLVLRTAEIAAEVRRMMERVTSLAREERAGLLWTGKAATGEITELLQRVRLLDREVAAVLSGTFCSSAASPFQTLTCIGEVGDPRFSGNYSESEVYPGRVDVYPDVMTASLWNTARVSRLILASSSIRLMAWLSNHCAGGRGGVGGGDYRDRPEYIITRQICEGIIADIIASVPVLLGWRPPPRQAGSSFQNIKLEESESLGEMDDDGVLRRVIGQSGVGFACGTDGFLEGATATSDHRTGDHRNIKSLAGLFLTWPLVSIKNNDFCSPTQREWVTARLRCIDQQAGLRHAGVVNQVPFRYPSMLIRMDGGAVMPNPMPGKKVMPLLRRGG